MELISKDHLVELGISLCVLLGQVDRVGDLLHCGKALLLQDILLIPGQHRFKCLNHHMGIPFFPNTDSNAESNTDTSADMNEL